MEKSRKAILSANLKKAFLFLFFSSIFFISSSAESPAQTKNANPTEAIQDIEKRIEKIEKNQTAMLENQEKILDELKNLRVWVRRN